MCGHRWLSVGMHAPSHTRRMVAFSDESSFECQQATRQRVWLPAGSPRPVYQRVKHPTKDDVGHVQLSRDW